MRNIFETILQAAILPIRHIHIAIAQMVVMALIIVGPILLAATLMVIIVDNPALLHNSAGRNPNMEDLTMFGSFIMWLSDNLWAMFIFFGVFAVIGTGWGLAAWFRYHLGTLWHRIPFIVTLKAGFWIVLLSGINFVLFYLLRDSVVNIMLILTIEILSCVVFLNICPLILRSIVPETGINPKRNQPLILAVSILFAGLFFAVDGMQDYFDSNNIYAIGETIIAYVISPYIGFWFLSIIVMMYRKDAKSVESV